MSAYYCYLYLYEFEPTAWTNFESFFFKFLMDSWAHASPSLQMTPYIIKIDLWKFGSVGALQRQSNQSYWQHDSKDAELTSLSFYYIYFFGFGEPNRNNSLHHRRVHMSNPQLPIDHSTAIYQSLHWYHAHVTYCMFILTLWFSKASQEFLCAHRWCGAHTSLIHNSS